MEIQFKFWKIWAYILAEPLLFLFRNSVSESVSADCLQTAIFYNQYILSVHKNFLRQRYFMQQVSLSPGFCFK